MGVVLDPMIFVHAINKRSKYQKEAIKIIKEYKDNSILCFPLTFIGIYNILSKHLSEGKIKLVFMYLMSNFKMEELNFFDFIDGMKLSKIKKINLFDALLIAFAKRRGYKFITLDEEFGKTLKEIFG